MTTSQSTANLLYGKYVITAGRVYLADVDCHFISCGDVREPRCIVSVDLLNPATGETLADVEAMAFDPISRKPAEDHLAHLIATYAAPVDPAPAAVDTGTMHGPALDELLDLSKTDTLICWGIEKSSYREETYRIMFRRGRMSMEASCAKRANEDRAMAAFCAKLIPSIGIDFAHALKAQYKHAGVLRAQRQFGSGNSPEPTPAAIIDAAAQSLGRELTTREACALFAEPAHTHDLSRPATLPQLMACPACCAPQPGDIEWSLD